MEKFTLKQFSLFISIISLLFISSCIECWVWYAFDDKLSELTGFTELGNVSFWHMLAFTTFLKGMFSRPKYEQNKD